MTSDQGVFLFVDDDLSQVASPSRVFYRCLNVETADLLCRLFNGEYATPENSLTFWFVPFASVSQEQHVLYSEVIQELDLYSDPDVHIYDPMPSESVIKRARLAARASEWHKLAQSGESDQLLSGQHVASSSSVSQSVNPSNPKKRRFVQEHSDLVVLFMIARDLEKIGRDYPKSMPKSEYEGFLDEVLGKAEGILGMPHFRETKELLESVDDAEVAPVQRYGITMSTLLAGHPEFVVPFGGDGQSGQIHEEIARVMKICQDSVSSKVDKMKARLAQIMVISCRMPEDKKNKEFSEIARFFQMLQYYWPLALRLIQIQAEGKVGYQPHPLLDFIVSLQDRLQTCFSRLPSDSETQIAHEACSNLMEVMVDGEIDDLSAVPEWTNSEILKVNTFIAKMRMRMGIREYELTCAEEYFVKHVGYQIDQYKNQTNSAWERILKNADAARPTRESESDSSSSISTNNDRPEKTDSKSKNESTGRDIAKSLRSNHERDSTSAVDNDDPQIDLRAQMVRLKEMENNIIISLGEKGIVGLDADNQPSQKMIAQWAGYAWDTSLKTTLSGLVKSGFLSNGNHHGRRGGYFLTMKGKQAADLLERS